MSQFEAYSSNVTKVVNRKVDIFHPFLRNMTKVVNKKVDIFHPFQEYAVTLPHKDVAAVNSPHVPRPASYEISTWASFSPLE